MKSKGSGANKHPALAPAGWQNASLDSLPRILSKHGPWLEAQGRRQSLSTLLDCYCPTALEKRAAIIILSTQVRYWKEKAADILEVLRDHNIQDRMPRRLWNAILKHASEWAAKQPPKWGRGDTGYYAWLAAQHTVPPVG